MSRQDNLINQLLILSINHNSQVLEIATYYMGNMDRQSNVKRAQEAFINVHESYKKASEEIIALLEEEES